MIVRFKISNFLSFKEETCIDLQASSITEFEESNTFSTPFRDMRLLKSLLLYGPNSSGKSNMFKALLFMKWFMLNSSKDLQANEIIDVQSFRLSTTMYDKPSTFEIELILDGCKYRYGFETDRSRVHKEWLFCTKKIKEYPLFERFQDSLEVSQKFDCQLDDRLKKLIRDNALFISSASQLFNSQISQAIIKKMSDIKFISGTREKNHIEFTADLLEDKKYKDIVKNFILSADLGFSDIKAERIEFSEDFINKSELPNEIKSLLIKEKTKDLRISTEHEVFDENFTKVSSVYLNLWRDESLGTRKFISLAGPIVDAILNGKTLLIDEFSARMHPVLSKALMTLFNSEYNNPYNAQFVMASHNTNFINKSSKIFRRDQMVLFKKSAHGATHVNTLFDQRIRKDASFEKEYLLGKYESIPAPKIKISNQLDLFRNSN